MTSIHKDFFRTCILKRSLSNYYDLAIHNPECHQIFNILAIELNKAPNLTITESVLKNIYNFHTHDTTFNQINPKMTKIFLSCVMIKFHPQILLSEETEIELKGSDPFIRFYVISGVMQ